ncbi:hypothetical protein EJ08DRAFT_451649 [Tothia fuscella]|uniref:Uncharacterized protein n=1 Tax=Tothia fuscella TaxID=1048955 RepID=A0A9P4NIZ7_9PEZI|nr:hypothetical protein EJ08DRAFT_451649 [Tothia fuscella]
MADTITSRFQDVIMTFCWVFFGTFILFNILSGRFFLPDIMKFTKLLPSELSDSSSNIKQDSVTVVAEYIRDKTRPLTPSEYREYLRRRQDHQDQHGKPRYVEGQLAAMFRAARASGKAATPQTIIKPMVAPRKPKATIPAIIPTVPKVQSPKLQKQAAPPPQPIVAPLTEPEAAPTNPISPPSKSSHKKKINKAPEKPKDSRGPKRQLMKARKSTSSINKARVGSQIDIPTMVQPPLPEPHPIMRVWADAAYRMNILYADLIFSRKNCVSNAYGQHNTIAAMTAQAAFQHLASIPTIVPKSAPVLISTLPAAPLPSLIVPASAPTLSVHNEATPAATNLPKKKATLKKTATSSNAVNQTPASPGATFAPPVQVPLSFEKFQKDKAAAGQNSIPDKWLCRQKSWKKMFAEDGIIAEMSRTGSEAWRDDIKGNDDLRDWAMRLSNVRDWTAELWDINTMKGDYDMLSLDLREELYEMVLKFHTRFDKITRALYGKREINIPTMQISHWEYKIAAKFPELKAIKLQVRAGRR